MRRSTFAAVALTVALAVAGCGADGGEEAGGGRGDLCKAAEAQLQALSDLYDAAVAGLPADELDETAGRARRAGADLVAAVPDELADDAAVLVEVGDRLADALAERGPGPMGVPDDVAEQMASPAYEAASGRVLAALHDDCGADPGAG
ncbi:MAG TPA: hypothetical protein VGB14_11245 [Acidimicrobiales bacterium]